MKTLFLSLLLLAPALAEEVPFKYENTKLVVTVLVNGQPKKLLLDTGAEKTIIHERLAHVIREGTIMRLGSAEVRMPVIFIDMNTMQANVSHAVENAHVDGLLGEDFLVNFKTLKIDYRNKTVQVEQ